MENKLITKLINATDTIRELLVYYVVLIVLCSAAFSFFEHKDFIDSLWWAFVTALTIGYGDIYPLTLPGKVVGVVLMHAVTLFILPLLIARMATTIMVNRDAFTNDEQEEIKTLLKEIREKVK